MRVLIVEPYAEGHHASYLRWIVRSVRARGWQVVIASTHAALSHPTLANISDEFSVTIHVIADFPVERDPALPAHRLMRRELIYWKTFNRATSDVRSRLSIDAVIFPYLDYCFYAIAMLGSPFNELPWCTISMRLRLNFRPGLKSASPPSGLKWWLARRILGGKELRMLFSINPSVEDIPPAWSSTAASKLRYIPDPGEYRTEVKKDEARAALGIDAGKIVILVFGTIDERKGIDSLLTSLVSDDSLENYVVILAGRHSASFRNQLRMAPGADLLASRRLIVIDRFLADAEQNVLFTAADVVWLGYRNHAYMSGVLVLAGMAGLPVLGTPEGEIGRLIAKHDLGICASIEWPAEVTSGLRALLDEQTRIEMGQRARTAFAAHTVEHFGTAVADSIQC